MTPKRPSLSARQRRRRKKSVWWTLDMVDLSVAFSLRIKLLTSRFEGALNLHECWWIGIQFLKAYASDLALQIPYIHAKQTNTHNVVIIRTWICQPHHVQSSGQSELLHQDFSRRFILLLDWKPRFILINLESKFNANITLKGHIAVYVIIKIYVGYK